MILSKTLVHDNCYINNRINKENIIIVLQLTRKNMITRTIRYLLTALPVIILTPSGLAAQEAGKVHWYSIEEAVKLARETPRPIFIDTYTDWCSWCKKLDQETFSDPVIAGILNRRFYPVKFNAEGKETVSFQGRTFINDGRSGRTHQLAIALLHGNMSYPSVVFLNEKAELLTAVPGFRVAKEMEVLLSYFADKAYETTKFDDYTATFRGAVK